MEQTQPLEPVSVSIPDSIWRVSWWLLASLHPGNFWLSGYGATKVRMDPVYGEALARVPPGSSVLDLGCGIGLLGLLLHARGGHETHGIEWDASKARFAQRLTLGAPSSRVVQGDLFQEAWPPCSLVSVLDVLHYFPPERQRHLLIRIHDHLSPGGRLLLRVMDAEQGGLAAFTRFLERQAVWIGWNQAPAVHWRPLAEVHRDLQEIGFILGPDSARDHASGNQVLVAEKGGSFSSRS